MMTISPLLTGSARFLCLGLFLSFSSLGFSQNLILNGGFNHSGQGVWNTGYPDGHFTSDYLARPTFGSNPGYLGDDGSYTINGNPSQNHQDFRVMTSDQGGDGSMMIVNGSSHPDIAIWQGESINVTAGTLYRFSGYITNVNARYSWEDWRNTQAVIGASFIANGGTERINLGTLADLRIVADPNDWTRFEVQWLNPGYTSIILCIDDLQTSANGNDFAIDTLSFEVIPEPSSTLLTGGIGTGLLARYTWRRMLRRPRGV